MTTTPSADWNPNYVAFANAFGCTVEEALEDADRFATGRTPLHTTLRYTEWVARRKREFAKEHPEAHFYSAGTGPPSNPGPPRQTHSILDHAAWTAFLQKCGHEHRTL